MTWQLRKKRELLSPEAYMLLTLDAWCLDFIIPPTANAWISNHRYIYIYIALAISPYQAEVTALRFLKASYSGSRAPSAKDSL